MRTVAAYDAARALAAAMGQDPLEATGTFLVRSKSRGGVAYEMLHTPDGYAVHQGEGCEGERFNGPLGCWHSKDYSVTGEEIEDMTSTAVTQYQSGAVAGVRQFTEEDKAVLKQTICRGATDAELDLFVATCKHTGLDPFMRQIHAVFRNTNVGSPSNPKWEKVMSIQVGIDGYRLTAQRTGEAEGMDGPQWSDNGTDWLDYPFSGAPKFARVGIWRKGITRAFVAVARWEAYDQNNSMWKRMGAEQLAKCAEALALRRAFPAEMAALPLTPDYIDSDALEIERQEWRPAPDAIEGESRAVADEATPEPGPGADDPRQDIDPDDAPFEGYKTPPSSAPALGLTELQGEVNRLLLDCKQTWSAKDYGQLYNSLLEYMPEGVKSFDPMKLQADRAEACLVYVRGARGEPVPV